MEKKIIKEVKFLKGYSAVLTILLISLFVLSFISNPTKESFEEIDAERINIVESNGDLKMVISNSERQHPGMIDGEILVERERPPGILFFNEEQDEVGGLTYHGNQEDGAGAGFAFDQYKNDQILQLQYAEGEDGQRKYGLQLWDRTDNFTLPALLDSMQALRKQDIHGQALMDTLTQMNSGKPIAAGRLFVGKKTDKQVGLFIKDEYGNDRIRIFVDESNNAKLEFLDEDGNNVSLKDILK